MIVELKLRVVGNKTTSLITVTAENGGEEAILHLLTEFKTAKIERDESIHSSYARTHTLSFIPVSEVK